MYIVKGIDLELYNMGIAICGFHPTTVFQQQFYQNKQAEATIFSREHIHPSTFNPKLPKLGTSGTPCKNAFR